MVTAAASKLIFYLGETGFLLDLGWVVEVCEQLSESFDGGLADLPHGIVGGFSFRMSQIPVVDPALALGIQSSVVLSEKVALVLKGEEGTWALLVDRIGEIVPAAKFSSCEIPPILKQAIQGHYSQIHLLMDEPLICFEPQQYYGALPVGI